MHIDFEKQKHRLFTDSWHVFQHDRGTRRCIGELFQSGASDVWHLIPADDADKNVERVVDVLDEFGTTSVATAKIVLRAALMAQGDELP